MPWSPYPKVAGGARPATLVVAASNSSAKSKETADYVCDGISDQEEINTALNALSSTGGCVLLLEGLYVTDDSIIMPSNVALMGQGPGTIIRKPDSFGTVISNSDWTNGNTGIVLRDFTVEGGYAGIELFLATSSLITGLLVSSNSLGILMEEGANNIISENICHTDDDGIYLYGESKDIIINNICQGYDQSGIGINVAVSDDTGKGANSIIVGNQCYYHHMGIAVEGPGHSIIGNICQDNGGLGIYLYDVHYSNIASNICQANSGGGMVIDGSSNNNIIGNTCQMNQMYGIYVYDSNHDNIIGNNCVANSQYDNAVADNIAIDYYSSYNNVQFNICRQGTLTNKPRYGIAVLSSGCNGNLVTNNDLYQGGVEAAFSDAGTGTVTTAGNRLA